jgi:hypothetical protein
VCCSYCGKEIGALRTLRDSEFCCALHRKKYGERLDKALHEIAAPAPAPADVASFFIRMPLQPGNLASTLFPRPAAGGANRIRTGSGWPLTLDLSDVLSDAPGEPAPVAKSAPFACPPPSERWMPALPAEPAAAWLEVSAALVPADTPRAPRFAAVIEFVPVLDGLPDAPPACRRWMPAPAAEPAAAPAPADTPRALATPPAYQCSLSTPPPEPVAASPHTAPQFTPDLEPLAAPDRPFETPPVCRQWMSTPPADPVFSYLRTSAAPAVAVPVTLQLPALALPAAARHVAGIAQPLSMAHAEPVAAAGRPAAANAPGIAFHQETAIALPALPPAAGSPFEAAEPAASPAPQAVESLLVAAQATRLASVEHAPLASRELASPRAIFQPVPAAGEPLSGPAPAALESPMVASVGAQIPLAVALRMPPFLLAANRERAIAPLDARRLAPRARKPATAAPRRVAPRPLATLATAAPAPAWPILESGLPHPGPLPIEFHTHRPAGVPCARPEGISRRLALQPPKFALRPILEKLEEPAPQPKTARQEPGFMEIVKRPSVRRPPTALMVAGRAAAGFLLAASLGVGVANFRGNRHLPAREEIFSSDAALSTADNASSVRLPSGGATAQSARPGPVAWVRQAIANRAAIKIAENFHGMENWDRGGKGYAPGWSHHPDGYMKTGALALFRPTLKFTDYRLEFFGQIESKSIGWTVRAADARNYHAMKLTVAEAGIRPFVALVHYDVVNGQPGRRTRTPLNVMVHNNRPMQLAVDVRGNRLVTSIDGEEVDSFLADTLPAGGVGFFSEADEHARLYWMRVSRNDDFFGHICTLLADVAGVEISAEVRTPEFPDGAPAPAPGLPADGDGRALAAVWLGLPYLRGARKTRFLGTWRSQPWNT